jgi:predicted RNase H-like nuclease (RuvC/YqgF family)
MTAEKPTGAAGRQATTATALKAKIGMLRAEIAMLEAHAAGHQAEFRAALVEPDRAQQLMAELLRMTADLMAAREAESRLESELMALRSLRFARPWWLRMLAG